MTEIFTIVSPVHPQYILEISGDLNVPGPKSVFEEEEGVKGFYDLCEIRIFNPPVIKFRNASASILID